MSIESPRSDSHGVSRRRLLTAGGAALAGLSGCLVRGAPGDHEGEIRVDGSNTVLPHGAAIAEEFQWRNNRVRIPVNGSGTGAGFQRFAVGETDIQNASRQIMDHERERCEANGIEFIELEAVLDGIAIYANPENDWCDCLTVDELNRIWQSGSDVETWSDVRPDDPAFPDEEIELYGRDSSSGTFDYFTDAINGDHGNIRSDYSGTPDTNVIVRGVRGDRHALGFGGAGYYYENQDDLKLIAVDDGDGCIKPTRESIESGTYTPLSRPMYVYLNLDELDRPEFRQYARFFFDTVDDRQGTEIAEGDEGLAWTQWAARKVGYYAVPDETVSESKAALEAAIEERI